MGKRMDIEQQLRQAIAESGMSRYALSKKTGVAQSVLSHFVNGQRSLTLPTAARLAEALGMELRPRKKGT